MRRDLLSVLVALVLVLFYRASVKKMSIPAKQRALIIPKPKAPWELTTIDTHKPGAGEVLVRVEATALNPVDWKVQAYDAIVKSYPAILGTDIAGTVVQLGSGVSNLAVGDKIVVQGYFENRLASFQQYSIAKADVAAKLPSGISFEDACTIPVAGGAAFVGLYGPKEKEAGAGLTPFWVEGGRGKYVGKPIVILGGSSSVGQYALQFAKLSGFSPIITTVSPRNFDLVKSLGATHTIDRSLSPSEIISEVRKITSEPITTIYDVVALEDTQNTAYDLLAPGGTLVMTLQSEIPEKKLTQNKTVITIFGTVHVEGGRDVGLGFYKNLPKFLESGEIKPTAHEVLSGGLEAIPKGLERLKSGKVSAEKLVVRPGETP